VYFRRLFSPGTELANSEFASRGVVDGFPLDNEVIKRDVVDLVILVEAGDLIFDPSAVAYVDSDVLELNVTNLSTTR